MFLQTHRTAMGTKMAVSLPTFSWPRSKQKLLSTVLKSRSFGKDEITAFIELGNNYHPTIKFTAEISDTEITFLDTCVYKGERFKEESVLDVRTHFKPTETFQYTHFTSCHPPGVRKGFIKGEALRLLRTNSSKVVYDKNLKTPQKR